MKKSMILVGVLSIGYTYAQEGTVGINTDAPKATLEIRPNTENGAETATTNEGILAPRLSKARIANIDVNKLTEGTLVYVTDNVYTAGSDTAKNTRVAKIDEKGYYFYNGTEWVRVQNSNDTQNLPWIYNTDGNVELNHPNADYRAIYTDKDYTLKNFDGNFSFYSSANLATITTPRYSDLKLNALHYSAAKGSKIKNNTGIGIITNSQFILGLDKDTPDNISDAYASISNNLVEVENRKNYQRLTGSYSLSGHNGTGVVKQSTAVLGNASTFVNGTTEKQYGGSFYSINFSKNPMDHVFGAEAKGHQRGEGTIAELRGLYAFSGVIDGGITGDVTSATGVFAEVDFNSPTYTGNIQNIYGVRINEKIATEHNDRITNNYGLYISDINVGNKSYSIYTNAGKVRVGDLVGSGDRVVYVGADGVLKTGVSVATPAVEVGSTTSMTCNDANRGKMNFVKDVNLDGGKTADAFAVCLKGSDGKHYWRYLYGGAGIHNGTDTFGTGLE